MVSIVGRFSRYRSRHRTIPTRYNQNTSTVERRLPEIGRLPIDLQRPSVNASRLGAHVCTLLHRLRHEQTEAELF